MSVWHRWEHQEIRQVALQYVKCLKCGKPAPDYFLTDIGWFHNSCLEEDLLALASERIYK